MTSQLQIQAKDNCEMQWSLSPFKHFQWNQLHSAIENDSFLVNLEIKVANEQRLPLFILRLTIHNGSK
jgi:hypothetical protein